MKKIRLSIFSRIILFIKKHPSLVVPYYYFVKKTPLSRRFCSRHTDICIEGYHGSANTYTTNLIRFANINYVISSITHTVANLKLAIKYKALPIFIIRKPEDCIASRILRFESRSFGNIIHSLLMEYISLYRFVKEKVKLIYIVEFKDVTENTTEILQDIQNRSKLFFYNLDDFDNIKNEILRQMKDFGKIKGNEMETRIPTVAREEKKEELRRKIKGDPLFDRATDLYNQLNGLLFHKIRKNSYESE